MSSRICCTKWLEARVDNLEKNIEGHQEEKHKLNSKIEKLKNKLTDQNILYTRIYELEQILENERKFSLQNIICENLIIKNDDLFTENWLNRLRNLLTEIEIDPNTIQINY